jgi:hypothetical protein
MLVQEDPKCGFHDLTRSSRASLRKLQDVEGVYLELTGRPNFRRV